MRNPYEILGLDSTASMDDVKRAYRDLARQYNDDYQKMDEINAAYDTIIMNFGNNSRKNAYSDSGSQYAYNSDPSQGISEFGDIRAKLNNGRIDDAEMLLDGIPYQKRNAEWHYLQSVVFYKKNWLNESKKQLEKNIDDVKNKTNQKNEWIDKFIKNRNLNKLSKQIIDKLIEYINIYENGDIKIDFKYQDEYIEAINFINIYNV